MEFRAKQLDRNEFFGFDSTNRVLGDTGSLVGDRPVYVWAVMYSTDKNYGSTLTKGIEVSAASAGRAILFEVTSSKNLAE